MNMDRNRGYTEPLLSIVDYGVLGRIPYDFGNVQGPFVHSHKYAHYLYASLLLGLPTLIVYGFALLVRGRKDLHNSPLPFGGEGPGGRRRASPLTAAQWGLLLYMLFTILYIFFVSTTFESAENNRYRFNTEGFYVVLLGLFVYRVIIIRWKRRNSPPLLPLPCDAASRRGGRASQGIYRRARNVKATTAKSG